jgi:lipoate-protein ligase A
LNFSFIAPNSKENFHNFQKFTAPVIQVLQGMGVPAELSGRNDILVEGRKVSGNAQYIAGQRMVSHGTLLFDSDLDQVVQALNVKAGKIESKGIKSVRSRVANIREYLPEPLNSSLTVDSFRTRILKGIFEGSPSIPEYHLTQADWDAIETLADERYRRWEWNFGHSPQFNVRKTQRFPSGEIDACIEVEHGVIKGIKFYGDFFGQGEVAQLESRLLGMRYDRPDLASALEGVDVGYYFAGLSHDELLAFLY